MSEKRKTGKNKKIIIIVVAVLACAVALSIAYGIFYNSTDPYLKTIRALDGGQETGSGTIICTVREFDGEGNKTDGGFIKVGCYDLKNAMRNSPKRTRVSEIEKGNVMISFRISDRYEVEVYTDTDYIYVSDDFGFSKSFKMDCCKFNKYLTYERYDKLRPDGGEVN